MVQYLVPATTHKGNYVKAVLCKAYGPPESLVIEELPDPTPASDEVLVEVHFAALNFPDVLMIEGKYQFKPEFPFSIAGEFSGVVRAVGESVQEFAPGDEVFGSAVAGAMRELVVVPRERLYKKPKAVSFEEASGILTTYGTSYHALVQRAQLKEDETLLVTGAAGGVGVSAIQIGKALGARVIAAASSEEKLAVAEQAGADDLVNYGDGALKEKVKALTHGQGADVIYDPVGGDLFDQCMRCIAWKGRVLVIGFTAGIPKLPTNLVLLKGCQIVGVFYGSFSMRDPTASRQNLMEILGMIEAGKFSPLVGACFVFDEYAAALRCLAERRATGKVVVKIA